MIIAFFIIVAVPPGAARDKSANQIQSKGASDQQTSASPSALVEANAANKDQGKGTEIAPNSEDRPVRVTFSPEVFIKSRKDGWDKALVIFTGLIVIVGGFQIYFLWSTVQATKANAKSALLNAQAVINAERAWVDGVLRPPEIMPLGRLELVIKNHGKTPARVASYEIAYGLFEKEVAPEFLSKTVWPANFLLGSGSERRISDYVVMESLFPKGDGTQTGAYCVWINYSDLVSENNSAESSHRTFFVYYYRPILKAIERIPIDEYT